ncbi:type II RES/Xre toxin-antitoxin system antitoxin [Pedobacter arcticus]|uniref:type II RES/Xre toxin-antitoxin system antitoxin n=1 Tax=Pedobacter arcticus TaxID=752140 RepID=UPI0002F2A0AA|nr:MbcA/ParS/Xre antitoxin family protein [Pedobacter arcticus]
MKKPIKKMKIYAETAHAPLSLVAETIAAYGNMYASPISILSNAKQGLKANAALDFISVSGFTYDEFQETFKTTVKTIQNYVVKDLKLDAVLSEKLLKSFSLYNLGIEVFGSAPAFHQWLNVPAYGLGEQIPFNLMDTITGITLIEDELNRIAYGDLA